MIREVREITGQHSPKDKDKKQERANNQSHNENRNMPQPSELRKGFDPENMPPMPPMGMMPDFDENNDKSENASAEKKQRDGSDRKNIRYRKDSFTKGYWKSSKTDSVRIDFRNPESSFIDKLEIASAKHKCIIIKPVFAVNPD